MWYLPSSRDVQFTHRYIPGGRGPPPPAWYVLRSAIVRSAESEYIGNRTEFGLHAGEGIRSRAYYMYHARGSDLPFQKNSFSKERDLVFQNQLSKERDLVSFESWFENLCGFGRTHDFALQPRSQGGRTLPVLLKLAFKRDEHRKFRASLMAHRGALGDEHVARGDNTSISLALMAHSTGAPLPQHVWGALELPTLISPRVHMDTAHTRGTRGSNGRETGDYGGARPRYLSVRLSLWCGVQVAAASTSQRSVSRPCL